MSRRGPCNRARLNGLTEEQLAILVRNATDWLVAKAADLPAVSDRDSWKVEVEEVAALGRLVSGLREGKILSDDAVARKLAARTVSEAEHLHLLTEEYRRELGEHEAWAALLARFDTAQGGER